MLTGEYYTRQHFRHVLEPMITDLRSATAIIQILEVQYPDLIYVDINEKTHAKICKEIYCLSDSDYKETRWIFHRMNVNRGTTK